MDQATEKAQLRKQLRQQRSALTAEFSLAASTKITARLLTHSIIQQAQHLAYYWPSANECSPLELIGNLTHTECYLPVISSEAKVLAFYPSQLGESLEPNCFNILEPVTTNKSPIELTKLDIVLLPLLGFDLAGHRLGMGGGYYDQSFAFLKTQFSSRPRLIGLAYEFQKLSHVPHDEWDVDLDYVVTEHACYEF